MAAILCKGIGQVCEAVGEVICLPCKACGFGCSKLGETLTSPFAPYLIITVCLNGPPLLLGISGSQDRECSSSLTQWFIVNAVLAMVHLVGALYIVHRMHEDEQEDDGGPGHVIQTGAPVQTSAVVTGTSADAATGKVESGTYYASTALQQADRQNSIAVENYPSPEANTPHGSFARLKQVLCYDSGVAIYIVLVVIWCVWQSTGVSQLFKNEDCDEVSKVVYSLLCGFLYMSLAGVGFACSLCCLR